MSSLSDKILLIEKELDLESFRFKGENVWPVIRMAIYLSTTRSTSNTSLMKSAAFLWSGGWQFLVNAVRNLVPRHYHSVLITTSHYKVNENGKVFDRIIDPVIQYLERKNIRFTVWEFTGKFKYDRNISYDRVLRPIQKEIYFLSFLRKLMGPFRSRNVMTGDIGKLTSLLQKHNIQFRINTSFLNKLDMIFFQADFFQKALKRHKVDRVFVVCYYDVKCFSIVLAANRLGIKSVDLQHGVQGNSHLAYAHWPQSIISSTRFLPTYFYVWDTNSYNTILKWKNDSDKILLGGNKWMLDRARKVSNDIILVTLQPIDDFLPEYVINIIKQYRGNKQWFLRLHPRQHIEMTNIEKRLMEAGLSGSVNVKEASLTPLTSLLERTVLHVTFYSSVVIEASYYNIPTYFLDQEKLSYYSGYLEKELIYVYPEHDVDVVIKSIENEGMGEIGSKHDRINVLDNFINGK